ELMSSTRGMMWDMISRPSFFNWALAGALAGAAVSSILTAGWFIFHVGAGEFAVTLWPSSIMFMALDTPGPAAVSTVVFVYAVAIVENIVLYATIGALACGMLRLVMWIRERLWPKHQIQ
ncbi:MAG: hypothetical protein WBE41_15620, partial [Terracidiphilus sp.]